MTRHRYEQLASLLAALELDYWRLKAEPECCRSKCRTLYAARMVTVMSDVRGRLYMAARDGFEDNRIAAAFGTFWDRVQRIADDHERSVPIDLRRMSGVGRYKV